MKANLLWEITYKVSNELNVGHLYDLKFTAPLVSRELPRVGEVLRFGSDDLVLPVVYGPIRITSDRRIVEIVWSPLIDPSEKALHVFEPTLILRSIFHKEGDWKDVHFIGPIENVKRSIVNWVNGLQGVRFSLVE